MALTGDQIIAKLAKAPPKQKAAILAGVMVGVAGLYYYLFYSDLVTERDGLLAQRRKLTEEQQKLEKKKEDYQKMVSDHRRLQEELASNTVKLPASSELPAFLESLQTQATASNVYLKKYTLAKEEPFDTYVRVPVELEVRGDFDQLTLYFKLLYETPRIITIEKLVIKEPKWEREGLMITATFTASTFRQVDQPANATVPGLPVTPTPGQPGGKT